MIKSKHRICTKCNKVKAWSKNPTVCKKCDNEKRVVIAIAKAKADSAFYTICPACGEKVTYKYETGRVRARRLGPRYCRRCKVYKPIAIAHNTTVEEVIKNIPEFQRYSNWVRNLTRQQPVHLLENYDKRGKYSYHIDHKITIWNGFLNKIPAEQIADISNLRMLWWKDNLKRSKY